MATFANSKRNVYTKDRVKQLRANRMNSKPKKEGMTQEFWDNKLGKLQAAGHLKITGFEEIKVESAIITPEEGTTIIGRSLRFVNNIIVKNGGEQPHLTGYLESASNADKRPYRIKGWFNDDGTVRLELVE